MQKRPQILLMFVVLASGLMLSIHLALVSNRAQDYIKVALEIPVQKDGHTNVELNIQSVRDATTSSTTEDINKPALDSSSKRIIILDSEWRNIIEKEEEEMVLDSNNEEYEVLFNTGEYELVEKDMDREVEIETTPRIERHHKQHHKYKKKKRENPQTTFVPISLNSATPGPTSEVTVNLKSLNFNENISVNDKMEKNKPYVMSKEEYYKLTHKSTTQPLVQHTTHQHSPPHEALSCSQPPCLQYLTSPERYIFNKCQKRTVTKKSKGGFPGCQCRFRNGAGKKNVAVVSLPGSGNTWVRGLLEKASGLCTGSIYCDKTLREGGFCGEGLRSSSLVAIKTHDSSLQWRGGKMISDSSRPVFDKAIFLIRNPFKANVAEWNRQMSKKYATDQTGSSHVKYVSNQAFFGKQAGWQALVKYQTHKWRIMLGSNLRAMTAGKHVLPVFFEDLKKDPTTQISKMMEFLEIPLTASAINDTVMNGFTSYYRNHTDNFQHYTSQQILFVNSVITSTAKSIESKYSDIALKIRQYICL